jgi:hypothetical protein
MAALLMHHGTLISFQFHQLNMFQLPTNFSAATTVCVWRYYWQLLIYCLQLQSTYNIKLLMLTVAVILTATQNALRLFTARMQRISCPGCHLVGGEKCCCTAYFWTRSVLVKGGSWGVTTQKALLRCETQCARSKIFICVQSHYLRCLATRSGATIAKARCVIIITWRGRFLPVHFQYLRLESPPTAFIL